MNERLRLKAIDQDDLQIMAACLQDALIPLREMAFMVDDHRFMAAFDRFQWERSGSTENADPLTICQSVLSVDNVQEVKYRGLDPDIDGVKLELLTMLVKPVDDSGFDLVLVFAGDIAIKLRVSELCLTLEDFSDPWTAKLAPKHDLPDISSKRDTPSGSETPSGPKTPSGND
ncbi:MAG: DUF2948 family protein [Geminicoccaceae bacterium]